ncbi:MAG: viral A-type inclusion protein [Chitinophagaceae bacterium]|nr:viral A-type inclusion protein [Chitinophagaceae bacterium]
MKKLLLPLAVLLVMVACNSKKSDDKEKQAKDIQKEVLEMHDIAMPKSMKIPDLEKEVNRLLDSVNKLTGKASEEAAPLKAKLESLKGDLSYAYMAMDKWMTEFRLDSFKNNVEERIKYFMDEKLKAGKMKDAVLNSIAKADSLLKK